MSQVNISGEQVNIVQRNGLPQAEHGFMIVRQIECVVKDNTQQEKCLDGYQLYPILYFCDATFEDGGTAELIAAWDETAQKEIYIKVDDLPSNMRLINYQFHKAMNNCCGEIPLSLPDYIETHAFNPESVKNMVIKNSYGKWDFMNGRAKDKEFFEFSQSSSVSELEDDELEDEDIEGYLEEEEEDKDEQ